MKERKRRRPRLSQLSTAPPLVEVWCPPTESNRRLDGSTCPQNCPMKGALGCPLK